MSRRVLTTLGLGVLVLGLIYGGLDIAGAAVPGGISGTVTVDNTPTNPVPVQQQGTATVSVGNAANNPVPVQQQGTATVSVSNTSLPVTGTVKIDPTANTVQTSAADNPAFRPVELSGGFAFDAGNLAGNSQVFTVPAGNELVIQSVTFFGFLPTGEHIPGVSVETNSNANYFPSLSDVPAPGGSSDAVIGGGQTTIYVNPGDVVVVSATRDSSTGAGNIEVGINGYLVNLP
jgi:hypothetical protein